MGTLANKEDTDEMLHKVTCHMSLHCLLRQLDLQRKKLIILGGKLIILGESYDLYSLNIYSGPSRYKCIKLYGKSMV